MQTDFTSVAAVLEQRKATERWQSSMVALCLKLEYILESRGAKVIVATTSCWDHKAEIDLRLSVPNGRESLVTVWANRTKRDRYSIGIGKKGTDVDPLLLSPAVSGKTPIDVADTVAGEILNRYSINASAPSVS